MVGSSAMSSRRRPKRQRTRTTIYTDDNPTTFTTKKKRNSGGSSSGGGHTDDQNFSPSQGESSVSTPTPRPTPLTASSNTNANANFGWQQQEESVSEESESMPPPAPVVKRGPGRPPRNRTATTPGDHSHSHSQSQSQLHHPHHTRASSSSAGINGNVNVNVNVNGGANSITPNRNQHHHPDSYASPELPTPITSRSAPMSLSSTSTSPGSDLPVVVKRKRGRPPKNRPKQEGGSVSILYSISTSASASTEPSPDRSGSHSLSMDRPEALASAGESEHQHQQHHQQQHHQHQHHTRCNPLGRRSLPETSSSSTELVGTALRNRRSLDSVRSKNAPRFQNSNPNSNPKTKRKPPKKKRTSAGGSRRGRANSSTSWTPPQKDSEGTFVGHSVTVAPILPPVLVHDNDIDDNNDHDINYDRAETADNNTSNSNNNSINSNSNSNSNNRIRQELQSRYPSIFGGTGIPKSSSSLATPFSSASHGHAHPHPYPHPYPYASSGTAKGKSNQSQHGSSRLPAWTPLYDPPVFFDDDYDRETGKLDAANTMPVTRSITALTVRKPDNDYLVLGDSVGFVTIYSLGRDNINLPIAQLESVACQQRGKAEQERLRGEIRRRTKARGSKNGSAHHHHSHHHNHNHHNHNQQQHKESNGRPVMAHPLHAALGSGAHQVRSILLDTSDTAIHALGMIENRVVLANIEQLECMDVPSGTSLWVCALLANRFVTSLDMHLHTFDVLVSCSKTPYDQEASASSSSASSSSARAGAGGGAVAPTISPLMLLQHSENNVEICDANSPMLVQSPSCTAIWDSGAHNRLLFIALSSNRQEHQLVLVSGGSIDSWKVACKTKIPTRGGSASSNSNSCSETKLSQSPGGLYTLVASSRGIRLYQTESLQLLHVYGDQLALHGQSVLWKDCWLAGSYFYETNNRNTNTNTNRSTRKSTNRSTNTNNTTHNFTRAARGLPKEWLQCDDLLLAGAGAGAGETTTIGAAAEPAAEPAAVVGDTTSDGAVDGNDHDHGGDDDHENATRDDPKNINHHNINYHNRNYNHRTVPDLPPYIIGVPHTKGPKELCENLHVWKVEQPSVVPTITIPLPPKSDGALGLVGAGNGIANQSSIGSGGSSGGSGGSGNHQTGVAKDRIVLVTNNGKGHLLLPQMESNFAGIMYPPGYRVVTNNVEYIEGEDALDHVVPAVEDEHEAEHEAEHEHETDEQEKEHEEEHEDVDILGHSDDEHDNVDVDIDDDDDDDDLRKAIQQSLLELKKDEIAREAMKHDTYVDILVPENEPEREYLPCRPEPYLRQMINTEIEDDEGTVTTDDDEEENDGTTGTATGTTTATGAKSERRSNSNNGHPSKASGKEQKATAGAASSSSSSSHRRTNEVFVSHVLDLMPNMQKPKPLEEDCMSFTTTKVVVAVNPVLPARPGRGRKSRAANLETMLKASINPYLQSMMVSKQGVPGSGKGSKLWAGPISALDNRHHGCRRAIGSADAGVSTGALSSSANGSHSHSYAYAYTANNTLTVDTNAGPTLQHRSSSPMEVQNDDEADVVMGLLGLSPCHVAAAAAANNSNGNSNSNIVPSNGFVVSGSNQFDTRVGVGMGGVVAGAASSHVYSKGATYLGPSSLALFNAANANASNEHIQAFTTSSSVFSSDRDSPVEGTTPTSMSAGANANASNNNNNNNVQPNHQPQPNNSVVDRSCSACRGRLVIHSCGRRSLPIDYEEIARAEREKKEKEEEEKKRLRAEKRRLADQRRREAKKQKQRELEEKRQREELEEQERLQVEERRRLQADFASQDLDRQRRDLIVASYANHVSNNGAGLQTEEEGEGLAQTTAVHSSHVVAHPNNYDNENDSHNGLHQLTSTVLHNGSSFGPFSRVQANGSGSIFEQAAQLPSSNRDVKGKDNYQTKIAAHSNQTGTYSGTYSDHCNQSNPPAASSGITTTSSNKQVAYSRPVPSSLVQDASTSEIDALLGLANLADRKTTKPSGVVAAAAATAAAPSGPEWSNYASASASHGFDDETVSGSVSGEARRGGIPSYAALRGHVHAHAHAQYTDETATTGPATATARSMTTNMATATATAANSFVNGYRHHQTGESQSYAWSARPEG